jgi:hypothetical protein
VAMFGMPGGSEILIILITVLIIIAPVLLLLAIWLVARSRSSAAVSVPARWLADPTGRHELRYWSGAAWTTHVADGGKQSEDAG